jgi:hypothetical protein
MAKAPVARNAPRAKQPEATVEPETVPNKEPKPAPVKEGDEDARKIDLKKPFSMVWHEGSKHYYQDGVVYDRVYKTEMKAKG